VDEEGRQRVAELEAENAALRSALSMMSAISATALSGGVDRRQEHVLGQAR
jgi:hypothetical protein